MPNEFDLKFINFLKRHNLYDEKTFKFIIEQSIKNDFQIEEPDFLFRGCYTFINNKNGNLEQIIPCIPKLMDDYSVMIAIYTYVNALLLIPKINKNYEEDLFYDFFLPLFYKKIYILENSFDELLEHEERMKEHLLKYSPNKFKFILSLIDELAGNYNKDITSNKQLTKRAKRIAKTYGR